MNISEKELNNKLDLFIEENRQQIVEDIAALVAINSVESPSAGKGAPFGAGVRKALDTALNIAGRFGLETSDGDGYVGWAEIKGECKGYIATITHLDTVPLGDGWHGDALTLREKNGWLIGRGVIDDKGPSVICLYLAKFFKELGIPLRYGLRVLLGTNEETGMGDVGYYLSHNLQPLFCFSPDAEFPLVNGEKGILQGEIISSCGGDKHTCAALSGVYCGNILAFSGGLASNVVCEKATCTLRCDKTDLPQTQHISINYAAQNTVTITAQGVSAHAAQPQGGLNAIGLIVDYLLQNSLCAQGAEEDFIKLLQKLHCTTSGKGLGINCADDMFGALTCIGGLISLKNGFLIQDINIRYPTAITESDIQQKINTLACNIGGGFKVLHNMNPFYISDDSPEIKALIGAYKAVSGNQNAKPFTIGGGTYARHFEKAVSYGPSEEDEERPNFIGREHAPNEGIRLESLLRAMRIYALVLAKLQNI